MQIVIIKLDATGDVVRTTALLHLMQEDQVRWITSAKNVALLEGLRPCPADFRVVSWEDRVQTQGEMIDLVINLEDDAEIGWFVAQLASRRFFGAVSDSSGKVSYSSDANPWFDMSLVSRYGLEEANSLKFRNRRSFQELLFEGLGFTFTGEKYILPRTPRSRLRGDVAIASEAGPVWPMKRWGRYEELKEALEARGLHVNYLPVRPTILGHLADIRGHRCVVSGDSLPMHLAIGSEIPAVALFNCTSPWEIYDYGLLRKIVSPSLGEFFYKRSFDPRAAVAIGLDEVLDAVLNSVGEPQSA
jgi:heptosyltransferase-2